MYVDKPMRGHGLMQAIARVNRVFRDKPGGLVVDYLGLADQLKQALATYTESGGTGETALDQAEAVAGCWKSTKSAADLLYGFNWSDCKSGKAQERLAILACGAGTYPGARGRQRPLFAGGARSIAPVALVVPHDDALRIRDDVAFFQAVRAVLIEARAGEQKTSGRVGHGYSADCLARRRLRRRRWTFSRRRVCKNRTSQFSRMNSWPKCKACRRRNLAVELLQKAADR